MIAIAKFDDLHISDTVTAHGNGHTSHLHLDPIKFPTPMVPRAVEPKTREDEPKISAGLAKIADEDPTFTYRRDAQTHELVISGMSELHLDVIQHRLKNRYKLDINTHIPHVPYLETIGGTAEAHHRHKKQTGGRGQFADVHIRVRPRARGEGFHFVDAIKGGVIPNQFIPAVEKGVREQLEKGIISGNPVVDVEVELFFGGFHAVDSSEQAFKTASAFGVPARRSRCGRPARPAGADRPSCRDQRPWLEKFGDITRRPLDPDAQARSLPRHGQASSGGLPGRPGDRPAQRGAPLRHRPQEHDRRPGLVHDGVQVLRARPAQRPAADRRQMDEGAGGRRGGLEPCGHAQMSGALCPARPASYGSSKTRRSAAQRSYQEWFAWKGRKWTPAGIVRPSSSLTPAAVEGRGRAARPRRGLADRPGLQRTDDRVIGPSSPPDVEEVAGAERLDPVVESRRQLERRQRRTARGPRRPRHGPARPACGRPCSGGFRSPGCRRSR